MQRHFLVVLGSAREGGNAEILAKEAEISVPEGSEIQRVRLRDYQLPPFDDVRHEDASGYAMPTGKARELVDATLWATDLVFASPTYWYSLPATAKLYLDHWTAWLRLPPLAFRETMKGRALWAITVNSDDPGEDEGSAPLIHTLELTAKYMEMRFAGALIGHGNRPGDVKNDHTAMRAARTFFREGSTRRG